MLKVKPLCYMVAEGYGRLLSSLYGGITGGLMASGQKSSNLIGNLPWFILDDLGNSLRDRPLGVLHFCASASWTLIKGSEAGSD